MTIKVKEIKGGSVLVDRSAKFKVPMSKPSNIPPPKNDKEANNSAYSKYYKAARILEWEDLEMNNTWEECPRSQVPKGAKILRSRFVYDDKRDSTGKVRGAKARLVAMGNTQVHGDSYWETFASVSNIATFRLALAKINLDSKNTMFHLDIKQAFTQAPLDEEMYMLIPSEFQKKGREWFVLRVKKALYGTKQAARCFQIYLKKILGLMDLKPIASDSATYYLREGDEWIFMPTHVDDLFPCSNSPRLQKKIVKHLSRHVEVSDLGEISYALKTVVEIDHLKGVTKISSGPYIRELIERYGMEDGGVSKMPILPDSKFLPQPEDYLEQPNSERELAEKNQSDSW